MQWNNEVQKPKQTKASLKQWCLNFGNVKRYLAPIIPQPAWELKSTHPKEEKDWPKVRNNVPRHRQHCEMCVLDNPCRTSKYLAEHPNN